MKRVGRKLARGIAFAAAFLAPLRLVDPPPSSLERALFLVRSQDFTPLFESVCRRLEAPFAAERQERFLEELFGLSGKWKALTRGRASYERYVRKAFERHVFGPAEFEQLLEGVRGDVARAFEAAENRLLVALFEDARAERPALRFERFRDDYARLASDLRGQILGDAGLNALSLGAGEAAATAATAGLTSAGILGGAAATGTAGGAWTFGVGLVVSVAAGLAVDAWVGGVCEDAARAQIRAHLAGLRNRLAEEVTRAVGDAVASFVRLQERAVRELYGRAAHGRVAGRF
jgi:hypothetical protein